MIFFSPKKPHPKEGERMSLERQPRFYLYYASFDPPGKHNIQIAQAITDTLTRNDLLWIVPYGNRETEKGIASAHHRREMILDTFSGEVPSAIIDFADMKNRTFRHNVGMQRHFAKRHPSKEIWHVIGARSIQHGAAEQSKIHKNWKEGAWAFQNLNFLVIQYPDHEFDPSDLPPSSEVLPVDVSGTNKDIRERVRRSEPIDDLVPEHVAAQINEYRLYR